MARAEHELMTRLRGWIGVRALSPWSEGQETPEAEKLSSREPPKEGQI